MTALKVIAVIVLLIIALLMLRIRIRVRYREEIELIVGASVFMIKILPRPKKKVKLGRYSLKNIRKREAAALKPKKEKKPKKKKQKPEKSKPEPTEGEEKPKKKMQPEELIELVGVLLEIVGEVFRKFGRYPRVDVRQLFIRVASDDPAKTAQLYGYVSQAMIFLREIFLNVKNFHTHRDTRVGVEADFMSDKILVGIDLEFTIKIWHLLSIGLGAAIRFIKHILKPKASDLQPSQSGGNKPKKRRSKKKRESETNKKTNNKNGNNISK